MAPRPKINPARLLVWLMLAATAAIVTLLVAGWLAAGGQGVWVTLVSLPQAFPVTTVALGIALLILIGRAVFRRYKPKK